MGAFALGALDPLSVKDFSGFDLPDDLQVVDVLSDGTTTHNAVLQQGASGLPQATLSGRATAYSTIAQLRVYRATHEALTFTEPDAGAHTVVVQDFSSKRVARNLYQWDWSCTLLETEAP